MIFKLFLFLVFLFFVGCGGEPKPVKVDKKQLSSVVNIKKVKLIPSKQKTQIVWDSHSKVYISDSEYDKVLIKYVESKYPKRVKNYKWKQKKIRKQKEIKRKKKIAKQKKQKYIRKYTTTINGLMWQDNKVSKTIYKDWQGAKDYCKSLSLVGYSDWRLPNINELKNLYKKKDKLKNFTSNYYWSSTTHVSNASGAWDVHFSYGNLYNVNKTVSVYVRCVRAVQ